jgi:hypothetical protein
VRLAVLISMRRSTAFAHVGEEPLCSVTIQKLASVFSLISLV